MVQQYPSTTKQTFIRDYRLAYTLQSSDKLFLSAPWVVLVLSIKAFSISKPSVWN